MRKVGVVCVLIGLLFLATFLNNTVVYYSNLNSRMSYIDELCDKYGFEPETKTYLKACYMFYCPSDWLGNLFLTAPSEQDLLAKAVLFNRLLLTEKALNEVIEAFNAAMEALNERMEEYERLLAIYHQKLSVLEARVSACEEALVLLAEALGDVYSHIGNLYNLTAYLNSRINELNATIGALAARVALVEKQMSDLLNNPCIKNLNQLYTTVQNLKNSVIKPILRPVVDFIANIKRALWHWDWMAPIWWWERL